MDKNEITSKQLQQLKKDLVARPFVDERFNTYSRSFPLYTETPTKLYIPKMYGLEKFGKPEVMKPDFIGQDWDTSLEFKGTLYESQIIPADILLNNLHENFGGILSLKTGGGKTFVSLYVLSQLQCFTLVVVNKVSLMNQWIEEIKSFLPDAKIGTIQGSKVDVFNKHIVIGMLQSLSKIDYPRELFSHFKCIIVDECHHTSSLQFSKVLKKISCLYTIGLTATPIRADACEYVFKWYLGEIVYKGSNERQGLHPILNVVNIKSSEYKVLTNTNGNINFSQMISELINIKKRNYLIIELIKHYIQSDRYILVLSDRRAHINELSKLLELENFNFTYGKFIGGMKNSDLERSKRCRVILATVNAMAEGVSIKNLDTLILTTPKKFRNENSKQNDTGIMEQTVGRILRKEHTENHPLIVDLHDNFGIYSSQFRGRKTFYKQHFKDLGFRAQYINLDEHQTIKYSHLTQKTPERLPQESTELCYDKCLI